jgi:hypothetical protein
VGADLTAESRAQLSGQLSTRKNRTWASLITFCAKVPGGPGGSTPEAPEPDTLVPHGQVLVIDLSTLCHGRLSVPRL